MRYLETIALKAVDPGHDAVGSPFVPVGLDSARVRQAKSADLVALWHHKAESGFTRITSPMLHDTTVGLKFTGPAGFSWLWDGKQPLVPGDVLNVQGSGGAGGTGSKTDYMMATIAYEGSGWGKYVSVDDACRRVKEYTSVAVGGLPSAAGNYVDATPLADLSQTLKVGERYAILGLSVEGDAGGMPMVGIRSPDWGNLRIGIPGAIDRDYLPRYFAWLSRRVCMDLVPTFVADSDTALVIDYLATEDLVHLYADLILGRL